MTERIDDLADILTGLGVEIDKTHGDEINGRCPVHYKVKGRESTRNSWYLNVDSGLWHCFTCGARGNLSQLLSELADDPGTLWNAQSFLISSGLRRLNRDEAQYDAYVQPEVDWVRYAKFPDVPDSVLQFRKIEPDKAKFFGVKWDPEDKATIVPITSPLGELRGWQAKKTGWVRNRPEGVNKSTTLFGIERAFGEVGVLLESPLDVPRFHSAYDGEINAVSSFGANVSDEQIRLMSSRFSRMILALDNDQAGEKETKRLIKKLPSFRNGLYVWEYGPDDPKDIGEMTNHQMITGVIHRLRRIG